MTEAMRSARRWLSGTRRQIGRQGIQHESLPRPCNESFSKVTKMEEWRKRDGAYEHVSSWLTIRLKRSRWIVADQFGQTIYATKTLKEAQGYLMPVDAEVGPFAQTRQDEWRSSAGWILRERSDGIQTLPPVYLPQEIRTDYFYHRGDSLKNCKLAVIHRLHPDLLERFTCKSCRRPALDGRKCPICRAVSAANENYRQELFGTS